jgi:hypothetical protein
MASEDYLTEKFPEILEGMKGRWFHQGKFFENSDDFWRDVEQWPKNELDQETAERLFKSLSKDCVMNIFLLGRKLTNNQMINIMEEMFKLFMQKVWDLERDENE